METISLHQYKSRYLAQFKPKPKRKQIEGEFQRNLGQMLNGSWAYRLNPKIVFWTYSGAGEYKTKKTAGLQKVKGLHRGDWDYRFEIDEGDILRIVYVEAKSGTGSLTKEQKIFQERKKHLKNVMFGIVEDMQQSEKFFLESGVFVR